MKREVYLLPLDKSAFVCYKYQMCVKTGNPKSKFYKENNKYIVPHEALPDLVIDVMMGRTKVARDDSGNAVVECCDYQTARIYGMGMNKY